MSNRLPPMTLPQETIEAMEMKAEHEAALHFNPKYSPDQNTACRICYRNGAKEYATRLQLIEQENAQLKRWKMEAAELLNPILDYGQSKEAGIPLGENIVAVVLERCKQLEQAREELLSEAVEAEYGFDYKSKYEAAHALLEKVIYRHEGGLLPDRFIYDEIKTFLDGKH